MSVRKVASHAVGNCAVMTIGFFLLFPLLAPVLLWLLKTVLEALSSVGGGG